MLDPFPIEELVNLKFGSVDGFKDKELNETFIKTQSIETFLQDRHSIIVGPMGSGKSALFSLLKNKSKKMEVFTNRSIITIDELIPFDNIEKFIKELSDIPSKQVYQFIWKFHICKKISEYITITRFSSRREGKKYKQLFKRD